MIIHIILCLISRITAFEIKLIFDTILSDCVPSNYQGIKRPLPPCEEGFCGAPCSNTGGKGDAQSPERLGPARDWETVPDSQAYPSLLSSNLQSLWRHWRHNTTVKGIGFESNSTLAFNSNLPSQNKRDLFTKYRAVQH